MAKPPTPSRVLAILHSLEWQGHVELSDLDLTWLATQIAAKLDEKRGLCGSCGFLKEILVPTRLGDICEECLEEATETAEAMREGMES